MLPRGKECPLNGRESTLRIGTSRRRRNSSIASCAKTISRSLMISRKYFLMPHSISLPEGSSSNNPIIQDFSFWLVQEVIYVHWWEKILTELAGFNPWPRICLMHTNIIPDILSGNTIAYIVLPLVFGISFKRQTSYFTRPKKKNTNQASTDSQNTRRLGERIRGITCFRILSLSSW